MKPWRSGTNLLIKLKENKMFNDYCTTNKYLVLIEETGADYPFLFRTTSNFFVAKTIVDNYMAGISDSNPDAELEENEDLSHPNILNSWTIKLKLTGDVKIYIYEVKNVEIKL
jgi:hypothetical protein